ncbi:hypothetical protein BVY04_04170 [bacterium M21]|nr:hypothetical protein BVY04_04170 [bacterium M21]
MEGKVKAIWLMKLIEFIEWPTNNTDTIIIGVVGKDGPVKYLQSYNNQTIATKKVQVRIFKKYPPEVNLKQCDIIFICKSQRKFTKRILKGVEKSPIVTAGEFKGFIDQGGVINFLVIGKHVKFEINQQKAQQVKIRIDSQILGHAIRVIKKKLK